MKKWMKAKRKESDNLKRSLVNPFTAPGPDSAVSTGVSDEALTTSAAMTQSSPADEMEQIGAASGIPSTSQKLSATSTIRKVDVALGQTISVLLRSPHHKTYSLGDLEWRVLPGILSGQYTVIQAQQSGVATPVGVALWASVSSAVDQRLSDLSAPLQLKSDEWRSGDIPWLIELVADTKVQQALLKHLGETVFKGQVIKMRVQGADGKTQVGTFKSGA